MSFKLLFAASVSACLASQSYATETSAKELEVPSHFEAPASDADGASDPDRKPRGISGMACLGKATDPSRPCFVINDEEKFGQFAELKSDSLTPLAHLIVFVRSADTGDDVLGKQRIAPCPKGKSNNQYEELDGEGIAYADDMIFVSSSHSCNGKDKYKASSYLLTRFAVKPDEEIDDTVKVERTWRLADALAASEVGKDFGNAKTIGTNIEGIAVMKGNLYAGLRTPVDDGVGYIVVAPVDPLFAPGKDELPEDVVHTIKVALGAENGIRDLAALDDQKLLILSGPTLEQENVAYEIRLLDDLTPGGPREARTLMPIPKVVVGSTIGKAETLTVLSNDASGVDVAVLYDNLDEGHPMVFHLPPIK